MSASNPKTQSDRPDGDLAEFGYRQELNRTLSTADLLIYGLVFMVPIAPWAIFGVVFNEAKGMVPLVYLIGLVAMIFTALSYAQMSRAFPIAGSVYSYVGRRLHPVLGFFAGWTILLDYLLVPTLLSTSSRRSRWRASSRRYPSRSGSSSSWSSTRPSTTSGSPSPRS